MNDDAYHQLCAYTLSLGDAEFIHQHVVDAHAAQTTTVESKPIGVAFALVGLYLHLERGFTGREVQSAHMRLAKSGPPWPVFPVPPDDKRGSMAAEDVLAAPEGPPRATAIEDWCRSVWEAWTAGSTGSRVRDDVIGLLADRRVVS